MLTIQQFLLKTLNKQSYINININKII